MARLNIASYINDFFDWYFDEGGLYLFPIALGIIAGSLMPV